MNSNPAFYLVIDLEATCDESYKIPKPQTEIIEIGAVLADAATLEPVDEIGIFVRPVVHRQLTPFCTQLTSITQADVDGAPLFPKAIAALAAALKGRDFLFCSWGDYDKNQLERDARRHGVSLPLGKEHLNLKRANQPTRIALDRNSDDHVRLGIAMKVNRTEVRIAVLDRLKRRHDRVGFRGSR